MPEIVVRDKHGEHSHLIEGTTSIGRHPRSTICLHDALVSKKHAIIHQVAEEYVYEDLGSSNGSFLDGVRITKHKLQDGEEITLGKVTLVFHAESEEDDLASLVNISQIADISQVRDRINVEKVERFLPERQVSDLGLLRTDYEKLRLGHELLQSIGLDNSIASVLEQVSNEMLRIFSAARCVILLLNPSTEKLVPKVVRTMDGVEDHASVSASVLKEVQEKKTALLLSDTSSDERFSEAASLVMQGIHSVMCAPIMHDGEFFGVVHMDGQKGVSTFTRKDLQLFVGIVQSVAMAVANAHLIRKIEHDARSKAQFERLLSPSVVEQVMSGKITLEKGGKLRDVTILFADIRGFTPMARRIKATDVVAMLNRYFEMIVDVVFSHGGTVDKYIGDEIMVLFGAPVKMDHPADRAVACALEMQSALENFNLDRDRHGDDKIEIGIGINSGEVVVGAIGSSHTMQYTCIGDAVNIASRLTETAKAGQVVISEHTLADLTDGAKYEELPPVPLKGIDGNIKSYLVRELLTDTKPPK
ncbi:MAG: FHA domain-containing protein [Mariprofundaceae bacterium]|nr:FHA domain-containing protein [Mariprofundaceae bacterium]